MPVSEMPLRTRAPLDCRGRLLTWKRTQLMGILNVTPDSFFDGGRHEGLAQALSQAARMESEGATVIDVGGQSTRPGFAEISEEEEVRRVVPVIEALVAAGSLVVSVDTYKYGVAKAALASGAHVLNDIQGLQGDPRLACLAAEAGVAVVAMHNDRGFTAVSGDPVLSLLGYFERTLEIARVAGIARERVVLDPGIGFSKTQEQNLELLGRLSELHALGCPVLLGASRKSVIGHVLGLPVEERLEGTLATTVSAVMQGVQLLRVHDVESNRRAARMAEAIHLSRRNP